MKRHLTLLLLLALTLTACECPFAEYGETPSEYYRRTGYDLLTADRLPGLWQCYYPMVVGDVEFKEVRIFSSGKADIIMEKLGGSAYYAETVSFIGDNAFDGCTSLRAIYYDEVGYSNVRSAESSAHDTDVTEVARYDLQGRPCSPTTRGVQIIVYSDFTTRTVISD